MAVAERTASKGGTFRVLAGIHISDGPKDCECENCAKTPQAERVKNGGRGKNHVYEAFDAYAARLRKQGVKPMPIEEYTSDLVESDVDLERLHNQGQFSRKFERIGGSIGGKFIFDPRVETIDEFAARIRGNQPPQQPKKT